MKYTLAAFSLLISFGTTGLASGPGETSHAGTGYLEKGVFTYEVFEQAVDHVDLESCPAAFDPEVVFCRMTLASEMANVFVFAFDGDQPLLAIKSYELDEDFLPF
ncbi:hypothetical protein [uncultured Pelagimonas sp.]|uniref:hypothetical protein n=1 Tax=uncultured Pelagimonas sp. TaxID=1618102 RepID=UPI0026379FA6|nr:hypothetical protein [uncultured Pelagimonas sp.]